MKLNQLDLRTVDRTKVMAWARATPKGTRLERIDGTVPDQFVKAFIEASEGINDMPRGDIAFNDWKLTEAQIRQARELLQAGRDDLVAAPRDRRSTGEGVGFTEVEFNSSGSTRDPAGRHAVVRRIAGTDRPVAQGRDARAHPRRAVRLAFHQDRQREREQQCSLSTQASGFTYACRSTLWHPIATRARPSREPTLPLYRDRARSARPPYGREHHGDLAGIERHRRTTEDSRSRVGCCVWISVGA